MTRESTPILTLGVEDGGFPPSQQRRRSFKTLLVAAMLRESHVEDIRLGIITVDGLDATETLLEIVQSLDAKPSAIILGGISYGGFNFIDPFRLQESDLSSIIVTTRRPDNEQVRMVLQRHFTDWRSRWRVYKRLHSFREIKSNPTENPVFMQAIGISTREGEEVLKRLTRIGRLPEPLRVARMLAHGLTPSTFLKLLNS